ncbi:MAG TPA: hypothetical protein VE907_12950 [Gammaproteobacteria bacterium]|nr:hypothetical protein [Gammaproteobacteria bacterium]
MTWVSAGVAVGSAVIGASQAKKTKKAQDKEAQANSEFEASRAAKTNLVQGQVDAAYNSPARQQQYGTFAGALRDFYGQALDKKKLQATQQLKFGLAKQGQIGGSQQVDRGRLLGEEMTNAATGNERQVQSALANLKGNDEQSRIALRNQAGAGLQLNQVASRAAESEKQNIGTADVNARAKGIGDVFENTLGTYKAIQDRKLLAGGYNASRQNLWGSMGP